MTPPEAAHDRFPKLLPEGYVQTSPPSDLYNCVAWIARDVRRWWSPEDVDGYFWPWRDRSDDITEYVRLFAHCGFAECEHGHLERGFEKIAVYGSGEDFDHVAFQRVDGTWSSKLGEGADIRHDTVTALSGSGVFEYAPVMLFMKRQRQPHPLAETGLILP